MTPLHIEILLHYNRGVGDYRDGDFSATAVNEYIKQLESDELIAMAGKMSGDSIYKVTDRGMFFLDAICNLPLPAAKWEMKWEINWNESPIKNAQFFNLSSREKP